MLSSERRQEILILLKQRSSLTIHELSNYFNVSPMTIRRDLDFLAQEDRVLRIRGGVMAKELPRTDRDEFRAITHIQQKKLIARYAYEFIQERQTYFIDTGTTTLELAKLLVGFHNITVITNSINVLYTLASSEGINLIGLGGSVYSGARSFIGQFAESALRRFYCDVGFLGIRSLSVEQGLAERNFFEADLKHLIIKQSRRTILLADSSKFDRTSPIQVASIADINAIVTDEGISPILVKAIQDSGVEVHIAPEALQPKEIITSDSPSEVATAVFR